MISLYFEYNYIPYHYIKHVMYIETFDADILDYLPPEIIHRYRDAINSECSFDLVKDKRVFFRVMDENEIRALPHLFWITHDGEIKSGEEKAMNFDDMVLQLQDLSYTELVIKPCRGVGGEGVILAKVEHGKLTVDGTHIDGMLSFIDAISSGVRDGDYILQQRFQQHELLNRINPSSVNTIRIDTLVKDGVVEHSGAILRMSNGSRSVDNWKCGGIIVSIDLPTGALGDVGKCQAKYGGEIVQKHPLTDFRFAGTVLPYWSEIKDLVCAAAVSLLPLRYLGWDVAIGPDGPVILEANHDLDIFMLQAAAGGLRRTPIGQAVIQGRPPAKNG